MTGVGLVGTLSPSDSRRYCISHAGDPSNEKGTPWFVTVADNSP